MRGKIGMVFQHFNLFPNMTALGNIVEAPIHVLGLAKGEAEARALDLLDMAGLSEQRDRSPSRLSGGQRQVGRESCRASVCQVVETSGVGGYIKKKIEVGA